MMDSIIAFTSTSLFLFIVLGTLLMAFACMAVARSKGYSGLSWFFIGLVIGILGLIIIACFPSNVKEKLPENPKPRYRGL